MLKAELHTERKRVVLFDNSASLLPLLPSNGRHDFTVEHDLKEIGAHTLVCSTVYTDADQVHTPSPQGVDTDICPSVKIERIG